MYRCLAALQIHLEYVNLSAFTKCTYMLSLSKDSQELSKALKTESQTNQQKLHFYAA